MPVTYDAVQGGPYNLAVVSSASTHTKGSYVEVDASTSIAADGFFLTLSAADTGGRVYLLDIATGAASSEVVVVANLPYQVGNEYHMANSCVYIPLVIAAGTRLSARCQCSTGTSSLFISVTLVNGGLASLLESTIAHTFGANTGTSTGTSIDPGAVANTKGAYSQLTAATSTTNQIRWLLVMVGSRGDTSLATCTWALDIATGAAASEVVIVPDLVFATLGTAADGPLPSTFCVPVEIPTGTRLSARAKCTSIAATDRLIDLIVVGIEGVSQVAGGGDAFTVVQRVVGSGLIG